jgi:hypothetical protein
MKGRKTDLRLWTFPRWCSVKLLESTKNLAHSTQGNFPAPVVSSSTSPVTVGWEVDPKVRGTSKLSTDPACFDLTDRIEWASSISSAIWSRSLVYLLVFRSLICDLAELCVRLLLRRPIVDRMNPVGFGWKLDTNWCRAMDEMAQCKKFVDGEDKLRPPRALCPCADGGAGETSSTP